MFCNPSNDMCPAGSTCNAFAPLGTMAIGACY
jgi:hypothetical protein